MIVFSDVEFVRSGQSELGFSLKWGSLLQVINGELIKDTGRMPVLLRGRAGRPGNTGRMPVLLPRRAGRPGNTGRMPVLLPRRAGRPGTQAGCLCYCQDGRDAREHRQDACATAGTGEHRQDACATAGTGEHRQDACATAETGGTGRMPVLLRGRAGRPGNTGRMPVLLRGRAGRPGNTGRMPVLHL